MCEFALVGNMRASSFLGKVPPWPSREQGKVFICSFKVLLSAFVFAEVSVHENSDVLGETAKGTNHKRIFSVSHLNFSHKSFQFYSLHYLIIGMNNTL